MKFVADCMLGRLAKWLKILGFDVLYLSKAEDRDLVELARREGRVLLTRDTGLIEKTRKRKNRLFIASDNWEDQFVQVLDEFGLWDEVRPNSRCIECNRPLKPLSRERARNLVTPYVLEHASSFALCPDCGRVFWQGTHYGDMERKIEALLKRRRPSR
ncbi:MAG TPA: Mut7-C RNAse domain-containing protein [Terriglobales bacterium]|nr:Mut7-C RNAse domain-containing protein [Terriglobales bacterium]